MEFRRRARSVCVVRNQLLAPSETFIENQVRSYTKYEPILWGTRRNGHPLPGLRAESPSQFGRLRVQLTSDTRTNFLSPAVGAYRLPHTDLIHVHFLTDAAWLLPSLRRRGDRPLLVTAHGYDVTRRDSHLARGSSQERALATRRAGLYDEVDGIIAVSSFIARQLVDSGAPEEKISIIPIGVPVPRTGNPTSPSPDHGGQEAAGAVSRDIDILFVGRLVEKKGVEDLVEAVKVLGRRLRVVIIGDGPLRDSLVAATAETSNADVEFLGAQSNEVVKRYMRRARVFAAPSQVAADGDSEGFGMVFLEAALAGTPIAAYASGGVPEAVEHGVNGLLSSERDIVGLATSISQILDDNDFWDRASKAGYARAVSRFNIEKCTAQLESYYDNRVNARN